MLVISAQIGRNWKDRSKLENSGIRDSMFPARKLTLVWLRRDGTLRYVFRRSGSANADNAVGGQVGAGQSHSAETCCKAALVAVQPQGGDSGCGFAWRFPARIDRRLDWLQCCRW
jgi:hypothetical protein